MSTETRSFKRQFHPSISSYFGRSSIDNDILPTQRASAQGGPTLPTTIQSSLLNVGMRVRKSVPEGYKTNCKTVCGPISSIDTDPVRANANNDTSAQPITGLLPYCGILKVGGHLPQPQPHPQVHPITLDSDPNLDLPPLDFSTFSHSDEPYYPSSFPPPSSSQNSFSSATTATTLDAAPTPPTTTNKRRREDADEEDLDIEAQPVSPRSKPVSHTAMPNLDAVRAVRVPRSRVKRGGGLGETEMVDVGDFGEAEFLRSVEWGEGRALKGESGYGWI